MKKVIFLILILLTSILKVNAQKENGIVYSEHEAITKTKALLSAFLKGDKDAYLSFYADTVYVDMNGQFSKVPNKDLGGHIDWWSAFANLSIIDDKPAFPDAIEYKKGGLWVQDWLRWTGIHKETGINLNLRVHTLYSFNKEGKINSLHWYFDNDVFDEIYKSTKTQEDGLVYKYHPYINIVRKAVNAYCAKNTDKMFEFYTGDAVFSNLVLTNNQTYGVDVMKKEMTNNFENQNNTSMVETGHPVCVWYEKESYVVYTWWLFSYTTKNGVKKSGIPIMMTDIFNQDGKIMMEAVYYSSNHFQ
jgi:hypothetical protein